MNKLPKLVWVSTFVLVSLVSCKRLPENNHSQKGALALLDSLRASEEIIKDDNDRFFGHIKAIDVAIQLKTSTKSLKNLHVEFYKEYLKSQVGNFTKPETDKLTAIWNKVQRYSKAVNPDLDVNVNLIKIKTGHYGPNVFYTRGNNIFIPDNMTEKVNSEILFPILMHEWWHILSEYYPDLKEALYAVFGFKKHNLQLLIPEKLKESLLTNPDGVSMDFALPAEYNNWLMPLIFTDQTGFNPVKNDFMGHLKMEVYRINSDGKLLLPEQNANLQKDMQYFFSIIGDNTQYIIHPDEIVADNVMLAIIAHTTGDYRSFSKQGKEKIEQVLNILKRKNWNSTFN